MLEAQLVEDFLPAPVLVEDFALAIGAGIALVVEVVLGEEGVDHGVGFGGGGAPGDEFLTDGVLALFGEGTIAPRLVEQGAVRVAVSEVFVHRGKV